MSVQQAIDRLASVCHAAGSQSEPRQVATIAYMNGQATQAALSALVEVLKASGHLPQAVWEKALEAGYRAQLAQLEGAAVRNAIIAPGGKA